MSNKRIILSYVLDVVLFLLPALYFYSLALYSSVNIALYSKSIKQTLLFMFLAVTLVLPVAGLISAILFKNKVSNSERTTLRRATYFLLTMSWLPFLIVVIGMIYALVKAYLMYDGRISPDEIMTYMFYAFWLGVFCVLCLKIRKRFSFKPEEKLGFKSALCYIRRDD